VDPREQANEIVLTPQREHRVDQVVTNTGFALLDLEAVGEEVEYFLTDDDELPKLFLDVLHIGPKAADKCHRPFTSQTPVVMHLTNFVQALFGVVEFRNRMDDCIDRQIHSLRRW